MYPIRTMCRVLGVAAAGYYAWRRRSPSPRAVADRALLRRIRTIHAVSYGVPRIHAELEAEGVSVGRKRIARLMRGAGLAGVCRRRRPRTTVREPSARPAPDLVERCFAAEGPDRLWVADISYVPTLAGFLYLAVVLDAFSRRIVGWAMASHLRTELVLDAPRDGDRAAQAGRGHPSFRPGQPIYFASLRRTLPGGRCAAVDGIGGRCLRPRHVRELLRHTGMRASGAPALPLADPAAATATSLA